MGGQDAQRFDQREEQTGNDDEGNDPEDLPHHAGHEHQGHERRHRRQDREYHRLRDLSRALDGAAHAVPVLLLVPVDVLADDDRVVDHDAEHEDEREQGDDVGRDVEPRHQGDRPEERERDPEADPEGEAQLEKERQHDEDEREPGGAVAEHEGQPIAEDLRLVLPDRQQDAFGHLRLRALDIAVHRRRDVEGALIAGAEDRHHDRGVPVEPGLLVRLREAVDHRGHVAELQATAVGLRPQHEVFVLVAAVGLPDRAQQDLAAVGADGAAGEVERGPPHGVGDLIEGHPVPPQGRFRDLDGDLVGRSAHDVDLGDLRQDGQLVAHALGDRLQGEDVGVARNGDVRDLVAGDQLADDGFLGLDRERGDRIALVLDLVDHPPGVGAELELDYDRRAPFRRRRLDLLDAVDALNRLFDPDDDPGLDLFRGGAEVGDRDADPVELDPSSLVTEPPAPPPTRPGHPPTTKRGRGAPATPPALPVGGLPSRGGQGRRLGRSQVARAGWADPSSLVTEPPDPPATVKTDPPVQEESADEEMRGCQPVGGGGHGQMMKSDEVEDQLLSYLFPRSRSGLGSCGFASGWLRSPPRGVKRFAPVARRPP